MKIAVATEQGQVSAHFGHCEGFTMYDVQDGKVAQKTFVDNPGHQPGFLPVFLKESGADVIIAGGMGDMAQRLFAQNGIQVIVGASGPSDAAAQSCIDGSLKSTDSVCDKHENAGDCGGH